MKVPQADIPPGTKQVVFFISQVKFADGSDWKAPIDDIKLDLSKVPQN
jgi:hypothetical protein